MTVVSTFTCPHCLIIGLTGLQITAQTHLKTPPTGDQVLMQ